MHAPVAQVRPDEYIRRNEAYMAALDYSSDKYSYHNQPTKVQKKSDIYKYIADFIYFSLNSL